VARGRTYKPGKRVPGEKNAGIIATRAGTFEAFVNYGGKRVTPAPIRPSKRRAWRRSHGCASSKEKGR
jgi:hypothetical protein